MDAMNSPAAQNFGDFAYYDENGNLTKYNYVSYKEGIYVGYRYYETRYEDKVLGQGNAEVIRCGRFPRAALLVCDCDCFHLVSSKISSMLMQCARYSCMYCTSVSL